MPPILQSSNPSILLGTAMWGWTTSRETAFALLDEWYARGFREVDTATNYPIDRDPSHFRLAEKILLEWIAAHGVSDLEVMVKIGSVNNLRTPEQVLTRSFILMMLDEYGFLFGKNLGTLMVHWDNRDDEAAIRETFGAFGEARKRGLHLGLSGIKHPEIYARLNAEFNFDFCIQLKHNLLHSDYARYGPFHGRPRFIAYGINAGGLKLDAAYGQNSSLVARGADVSAEPEMMPALRRAISEWNEGNGYKVTHFNQVGMAYAFHQPDMQGILLGTSKVEQLRASIDCWEALQRGECAALYGKLLEAQ